MITQVGAALASRLGKVIDLFRAWDEDGNGQVSKKEFRRALGSLGLDLDASQCDELFESLDADGNGSLEYAELRSKLAQQGHETRRPRRRSFPTTAAELDRLDHLDGAAYLDAMQARSRAAREQAVAKAADLKVELMRMKRQLRNAQRRQALADHHEKKSAAVAEHKMDMKRRVGSDLTPRIMQASAAARGEGGRLWR